MMRIPSVWLLAAALAACSPTETVVVRGPISVPDPIETTQPADAGFNLLRIAELGRMETWDPLLARTHANRRVLSLMVEGLVGWSPDGRAVPALAWDWSAEDDSLTWTFRIREESRFHPDAAMGSGSGRRATSADVYATFARMADRNVPGTGAELFAGVILGFDLFNREQREVYLPSARNTTRIVGIETPDERTVIFRLVRKDPDFLRKLASPAAWITAPEAATLSGRTIGTGLWRWRAAEGDSSVTLVRHAAHPDAGRSQFNRVDVRFYQSETAVYRAMVRHDADLVPEAGPRIRQSLNSVGVSTPGFTKLDMAATDTVVVRWNPAGAKGLSLTAARTWIYHGLDTDLRTQLEEAGFRMVPMPTTLAAWTGSTEPTMNLKLGVQADDDFVGRLLFDRMRESGAARLVTGPVVSRDVDLYTVQISPFLNRIDPAGGTDLIRFGVTRLALVREGLGGYAGSAQPWSLDIRDVKREP